jgi:hypothetical protein
MKLTGILGAAGGVVIVAAGVAFAASYVSVRQTDYFAPGKHQFYVWCAGGSDFRTTETGQSAQDAQTKLYNEEKAAGRSSCWPVWQGRVPG